MALSSRITLITALALAVFQAQAVNVTVAYQTSAEPAKVAQRTTPLPKRAAQPLTGENSIVARASCGRWLPAMYKSATSVPVRWRLPPRSRCRLKCSCWRQLGNSEALVVKKSISKPQDLIGKRIAVPFISTTHYSLLSALKHWGIKPGQVQIINLQPPAVIAARQRGDVTAPTSGLRR